MLPVHDLFSHKIVHIVPLLAQLSTKCAADLKNNDDCQIYCQTKHMNCELKNLKSTDILTACRND